MTVPTRALIEAQRNNGEKPKPLKPVKAEKPAGASLKARVENLELQVEHEKWYRAEVVHVLKTLVAQIAQKELEPLIKAQTEALVRAKISESIERDGIGGAFIKAGGQ